MEIGQIIEWSMRDIIEDNVKIELYKANTLALTIENSIASTETYFLEIPSGLIPGTDYHLKISRVSDNSIYDVSDDFEILESPFGEPVIDFDGNVYRTVQIGDQIWMAENLKTTHYADGRAIPLVTDNTEWANLENNNTDDAYCYYNNNSEGEADIYGALYTWAAAMGDNAVYSSTNPSGVQGVCPDGWHLPSYAEWRQLSGYLSSQASYICDGESSNIAKSMASTILWKSCLYTITCAINNFNYLPNTNNSSGFSALPGGGRYYSNGTFNSLGEGGTWWCTNTDFSGATVFYMNYEKAGLYYSYNRNKSFGFSVRCIKD